MPKRKQNGTDSKPLEQYTHKGKKRANNPPIGLVTIETDKEEGKKTYAYDPHLDPQLQWAGKAEQTSFEVPTVSLHVHERIDPRTIIEAVRRREEEKPQTEQMSLFAAKEQNPPLREAIEFYKHKHNWTNRLIAGDSLLVMNSLLEKEGLAGHVQMIYIDPPYGIRYGSNFQPFVNKRSVSEHDKDEDLTQEPETIKAFRDTWELGIHSYLTYLRDRLLLTRELLHESGSIFVQINDKNVHLARCLMDEVFGTDCLVVTVVVKKKGSQKSSLIDPVNDYLLWYSKTPRESGGVKFRKLYIKREIDAETLSEFKQVQLPDGREFPVSATPTLDEGEVFDYRLSPKRLFQDHPKARLFRANPLTSGGTRKNQSLPFKFKGIPYNPGTNACWKTTVETDDGSVPGMEILAQKNRIIVGDGQLRFKSYLDDFGYIELSNWWDNLGGAGEPIYVVQTNPEIIQRCILMTTDPGDLVFDPTCGSGTTAYVAEHWGRRWITCDTSRVALTLARQRLVRELFKYYQLEKPEEGVGSGFKYRTVPHITLGSIANNEPPTPETLYDKPLVDSSKLRVTGPFTVEAVPAPVVQPLPDAAEEAGETPALPGDASIARSGETLRQAEWRDELQRTGIRSRHGDKLTFSRVEPMSGTRWLHADAEVIGAEGQEPIRAMISFGPEHAPLEQRQVEWALEEARKLFPKPKMIIFAAFQFDPEAAKDIEETNWPGVTLLKAQMNADLLTDDLKKKRASNESFWLIGQPDVIVRRIASVGSDGPTHQAEVRGFDYYDTRKGEIVSGGTGQIAMWMLDTDYDGRSLFPRQVFFPMAGEKDGWAKLAKNLKAEIDEELIEAYRGTKSLPFKPGPSGRIAVKIVDDRGIESFKVIDVP